MYKKQVSIIGSRNLSKDNIEFISELSKLLVDNGFRTVTGGLGVLQEAVHMGAKNSTHSSDCDTIAIIPGFDPSEISLTADVVIPTGLDLFRNVIVANSEIVIAVEGGAGTLSEISFAWQLNRTIIAVGTGGWSGKLSGETLDSRREDDDIIDCIGWSPQKVIEQILLHSKLNKSWHTGLS